jgi:hypothetical protein
MRTPSRLLAYAVALSPPTSPVGAARGTRRQRPKRDALVGGTLIVVSPTILPVLLAAHSGVLFKNKKAGRVSSRRLHMSR